MEYNERNEINIPPSYKKLIEDCWNQDPNQRPTFSDIVYKLQNDQGFITDLVVEGEYLDYIDIVEGKQHKTSFQSLRIMKRKKKYLKMNFGNITKLFKEVQI